VERVGAGVEEKGEQAAEAEKKDEAEAATRNKR